MANQNDDMSSDSMLHEDSSRGGSLLTDSARKVGGNLINNNKNDLLTSNDQAFNRLTGSNQGATLDRSALERTRGSGSITRSRNQAVSKARRTSTALRNSEAHLESESMGKNLDSKNGKALESRNKYEEKLSATYSQMDKAENAALKNLSKNRKLQMSADGSALSKTSEKLKFNKTDLEGKLQGFAKDSLDKGLDSINDIANGDWEMENAITDSALKAKKGAENVYKVSRTAIAWRSMQAEKRAAKELQKVDKLAKRSFKLDYKNALNNVKSTEAWNQSKFMDKLRYKKMLKKKYQKNAMKQFQDAKKAGAAVNGFSTGMGGMKEKAKDIGEKAARKFLALLKDFVASPVGLVAIAFLLIMGLVSTIPVLMGGMMGSQAAAATQDEEDASGDGSDGSDEELDDSKVVKTKGAEGVMKTAASQLGVHENPSGTNNVKYNTAFYGHKVSGSRYPWCCAFVWWCFEKSGNGSLFPKTAGCAYVISSHKQYGMKAVSPNSIGYGDIGIVGNGDHIALIVERKGNTVITIEGNTSPGSEGSQYNGGCVAKRTRSLSYFAHYYRPNYE